MSGNVQILTAIGNLGSARTLSYSPNESSVTNKSAASGTRPIPPVWQANGATTNNGNAVVDDGVAVRTTPAT